MFHLIYSVQVLFRNCFFIIIFLTLWSLWILQYLIWFSLNYRIVNSFVSLFWNWVNILTILILIDVWNFIIFVIVLKIRISFWRVHFFQWLRFHFPLCHSYLIHNFLCFKSSFLSISHSITIFGHWFLSCFQISSSLLSFFASLRRSSYSGLGFWCWFI